MKFVAGEDIRIVKKRRTVKTCRKRREFQPEEKEPVKEEDIFNLQRRRLATCRIGESQPAEEDQTRNLKMKIRATTFRRRGDFQTEEEKEPEEEEWIRNRQKRIVATCGGKGDSQHVEGEETRNVQKKW